jgi:F-type H+-transporting ATPase subunit b
MLKVLPSAAALCVVAYPVLAHAAGGGDAHGHAEPHGVTPTGSQALAPAITALLVFLVVFGILATQVWPKILGGLRDRENKIRDEIEGAELARTQAKDALEQYQKSLADARSEAQKMIEQAKQQQLAVAAELKAKADAELATMREKAMKDIESAKRAAASEIHAQAADIAGAMAAKILKRNVTAGDTKSLLEESLAHLQGSRN